MMPASRAARDFAVAFGGVPDYVTESPGRVNLIGEHTDYNGGFVLPAAINMGTAVAWRLRQDSTVRVVFSDLGHKMDEFRLDQAIVRKSDLPWTHYVRGMTNELMCSGFPLVGVDMVIAGNVPQGAGLSSSAALEVATGHALLTAAGVPDIDLTQLAQLAQRSENQFVGCQCGIMDQLVSAKGVAGHALLIDCQSLMTRQVPIPAGVAIVIANSMVRRGLVTSAYNERRVSCETAARHFGVVSLRSVDENMLADSPPSEGGLDCASWKRARHVVTENARTLMAADALVGGDLHTLGSIMAASHASMRDDFEITVPAVDALVATISAVIGAEGGVRMTGGGFGGCVVAVVPEHQVPSIEKAISSQYRSPDGYHAEVHVCVAGDGVNTRRL